MINEEIPEGYTKTSYGIIPLGWEIKILGDYLDYIQPTNYLNDEKPESKDEINCIPVLTAGKSFILGYTKDDNKTFSKTPVILFDDFTTENKYVDFSFKVRSSAAKILVAKNNEASIKFIFEAMQQINHVSTDHKRYWISEYQHLKFPVPPFAEQQKIVEILSTWNEAIENCKTILFELSKRKSWLAYNLVFDKKYPLMPLSTLMKRVKNPLVPEPEKLYRQIGIRSHAKGIFYKEEVSGLGLGNKSVFHIEPNCFILNIVFAWEHAIAKTTSKEIGMIASHRFPMFKPFEDKLDLDYLLHFFKSKKGKDLLNLASPGGAGRNKTLGQSEFLKLHIPVPTIKDQHHIAEVLDTADLEILLYQKKLKALQIQKEGLMQQLLTGKTRVKVN